MSDRTLAARKSLEYLQSSNLIDLKQSLGTFVSSFSKIADDIDGYAICYKAYHAIVFNPHVIDVIQPGDLTRSSNVTTKTNVGQ